MSKMKITQQYYLLGKCKLNHNMIPFNIQYISYFFKNDQSHQERQIFGENREHLAILHIADENLKYSATPKWFRNVLYN